MSNTADVTPYDDASDSASTTSASVTSAIADFLAVSEADRASDAARAQRIGRERLQVNRLTVRGTDCAGLIEAARALGYADLPQGGSPVGVTAPRIDLRDSTGRRLRIEVGQNRVELYGLASHADLEAVVRERTITASARHLSRMTGAKVIPRHLANGDVELVATEAPPKDPTPPAKITVRVSGDGVSHVDIENVRGNRCEGILASYAGEIGGQAHNKKLKPAYYESPPAKPIRVGIKR